MAGLSHPLPAAILDPVLVAPAALGTHFTVRPALCGSLGLPLLTVAAAGTLIAAAAPLSLLPAAAAAALMSPVGLAAAATAALVDALGLAATTATTAITVALGKA